MAHEIQARVVGEDRSQPGGISVTDGIAYSLGANANAAARAYAEFTGRSVRACERAEDLSGITSRDVVLCTTDRLTARLLHALYVGADVFAAPGLLTAPDAAALEALVGKQCRSLTRSRRGIASRVFIRSEEMTGIAVSGHDVRAGGALPHAEIAQLLGSNPAILALTGHSDGIDLAVSLRAFLCPFVDRDVGLSAQEKLPPCRIDGRCTKFPVRPTARAAADKGWLVPVSALRARIVIMFSCSLVKPDDGAIDPGLGLGPSIMRDADVDVLISSWREERETGNGAMLNPLIGDLSRGMPVGDAVAAFNRSPLARRTGTALALMGDPSLALDPQTAYPALPEPVVRPVPPDEPGTRDGDVALLLAAVRADGALVRMGLDPRAARALAGALSGDTNGPEVEEALIGLLGGMYRVEDFLGAHGVPGEPSEHGVCPMCGAPARAYDVRFPAFHACPRRIVRCACCMECINVPTAWETEPDPTPLREGRIGLRGVPKGARVQIVVMGYDETIEYSQPWPIDGNGRPVPTAPLYVPAHGGLLYCKIFVVSGSTFGSFGFKYRRSADGTLMSSALVSR